MPSVEVIVISYNSPERLRACLQSVLGSTIGHELRVTVVDNASATPGVAAVVAAAGGRLVQLADNIGYGSAFNLALRQSSADYCLVMNQDVTFDSTAIATLLQRAQDLELHENADILISPALLRQDGTLAETNHALPSFTQQLLGLAVSERLGNVRNVASHIGPSACGWVSAAFVLGPRATWEKLSGFDERYFMYVEDVDLFRRLHDMGGLCFWEPGVKVTHHGGTGLIAPHLLAAALCNWRTYFGTHNGVTSGWLILCAASFGAMVRGIGTHVRRTVNARRDDGLDGKAAMYLKASITCWICARHPCRRRSPAPVRAQEYCAPI